MRYLSLFSGIEAATAAWHGLGWECVGVSEIEPGPCATLKHHYPHIPNLGNVTLITEDQIASLGRIDLVVFGSPCQDLSVAGKRKGLDGARSGLFFTAMRIVEWARLWGGCRFALWENVPGAFSSNKGADFAAVVDALAGLSGTPVPPKGWGTEGCAVGAEAMVEWATLDAQWFGVAQRRRRVFALADFGDWTSRPPILLERESVRGDSPPRRETRQGVAGTLAASSGGCDENDAADGRLVAEQRSVLSSTGDVAHCLNAGGMGRIDYETETMVVCATGEVTHTLKADGFDASEDGTGRGTPIVPVVYDTTQVTSKANRSNPKPGDPCHPLAAGAHAPLLALNANAEQSAVYTTKMHNTGSNNAGKLFEERSPCLDACSPPPALLTPTQVRRLTPLECERLQAFPDGYTAVPFRGKPMADGPRYKALGNSMCVNVMRWIGEQIDFVHRFC